MKREGEIFVDHRASPGLPEHIARAVDYDPNLTKEGKVFEAATLTCAHCQSVAIKNTMRTRPRESCQKCGFRYVCDYCFAEMQKSDYVHTPFEKKVAQSIYNAEQRMLAMTHPPQIRNIING